MTQVGGRTEGGGETAARQRLAAELRKRREAVGLSQRALARATYFSSSYVTKLETGSAVTPWVAFLRWTPRLCPK